MTARKTTTKRPTRNPPIAFDDEARQLVRVLAGWGMPHAAIATQVCDPKTGKAGITLATLHEHFRDELCAGGPDLIATAIRTQHDLMTKGRTDVRDRVSAAVLRRFGLAGDDALVLHALTDPEGIPSAAREVDAVELEKAILAFLHGRTDQDEA
ncbi:hypothetical protein ACKVEX_05620 [Rhodocyclaceae bacterium SMB388]